MNLTRKLKMNTSMSLLNRIVMIISGLILPRLILTNYGSETNGLVSSISQFLGIITFLDLGVGVVAKTALYRPLARNDNKQISSILIFAKKYFQNIAYILVTYVLLLIVVFPMLVDSPYGYLSTGFLIFSISISRFGQFYLGVVNEILLSANQQDYIQLGSEIVVIILNLLVSVFLINHGATIWVVKLGSGLVYLIRPVFLSYYVKINFEIDFNIKVKDDPLPQRWSAMGQHIAASIKNSTDIVVLTIFSSLENISVYAIYNMVVTSIKALVSSITTGIQSFFGKLYASDEIILLNKYFNKIEWLIHTVVIFLYGMTAVLINDFVLIYTTGIEDISYEEPMFSFLLVLATATYSLRIPYNSMVLSAGHFKQTELSSYIEAGLNIVLSISLVNRLGLVGVAIGLFVSMVYRTLYLVVYLSRNIIFRPLNLFAKHILVDIVSMTTIFAVGNLITNIYLIENLIDWLVVAIILGIVSLFLLFTINLIFYKDTMISTMRSIIIKN